MALRLPFRNMVADFTAADQRLRRVGSKVDRNFDEVEAYMASLPNIRCYSYVATATRSTASLTYVDWPVAEVFTTGTFTKRRSDTRLIVILLGSGYMSGAAGGIRLAVRVDGAGTDHALKAGFINVLSEHQEVTGGVEIEDVDAGEHTFTLRAHVTVGTYNADTNDSMRLLVIEAP